MSILHENGYLRASSKIAELPIRLGGLSLSKVFIGRYQFVNFRHLGASSNITELLRGPQIQLLCQRWVLQRLRTRRLFRRADRHGSSSGMRTGAYRGSSVLRTGTRIGTVPCACHGAEVLRSGTRTGTAAFRVWEQADRHLAVLPVRLSHGHFPHNRQLTFWACGTNFILIARPATFRAARKEIKPGTELVQDKDAPFRGAFFLNRCPYLIHNTI